MDLKEMTQERNTVQQYLKHERGNKDLHDKHKTLKKKKF